MSGANAGDGGRRRLTAGEAVEARILMSGTWWDDDSPAAAPPLASFAEDEPVDPFTGLAATLGEEAEFEVDAGPDQTVASGASVSLPIGADLALDGSGPTITWRQVGGPSVELKTEDPLQANFQAPNVTETTVFEFEVEVSDGELATADRVAVTVLAPDRPPLADAGVDRSAHAGELVVLDATASSDPDGSPVTFQWVQVGGPPVLLSGADSATPVFAAPAGGGALQFEVTVHDGRLASTDQVTVWVDDPAGGLVHHVEPGGEGPGNRNHDGGASGGDGGDRGADPGGGPRIGGDGSGEGGADVAPRARPFPGPSEPPEQSRPEAESVGREVGQSAPGGPMESAANPVVVTEPAPVEESEGSTLSLRLQNDLDLRATSFAWRQIAGTAVTLDDTKAAAPSFAAPDLLAGEDLVFEVQLVIDGRVETRQIVVHVEPVDTVARAPGQLAAWTPVVPEPDPEAPSPPGGIGRLWAALLAFVTLRGRGRNRR